MFIKFTRTTWMVVGLIAAGLLIGGAAGVALAGERPAAAANHLLGGGDATYAFSYQGYLTVNGQPANGAYDFRVSLYDDITAGIQVGGVMTLTNAPVSNGYFSLAIQPADLHTVFTGGHRWLLVEARPGGSAGAFIALPRQPIAPAPYAWGLYPGTLISGTAPSGAAAYAALNIVNVPASGNTSPALVAESKAGIGVYGIGSGTSGYGVTGYSDTSNGGHFSSGSGIALYASGPSTAYSAYIDSLGGSTGPGLYVDGTFVATGAKTGYVVDIVLNAGPEALETGDVVAIVGYAEPVVGEIPVIKVRKASGTTGASVAGIVDQPFAMVTQTGAAEGEALRRPAPSAGRAAAAQGTAIGVGEYFSMVTLGSFKTIKVDASYGAIQPGDLLVASPNPGYAMRGVDPALGTVVGKALGELSAGQGSMPVLVTLK